MRVAWPTRQSIDRAVQAAGLLACCVAPLAGHCDGLLGVDNPAENGQRRLAYARMQAFAGNDQVALSEYGAQWAGSYTPRSGVNLGLAWVRAESGLQQGGYRLGRIYRAEALLQANRDTSDLVQQSKTGAGYDVGRSYLLDYQVNAFEADGLRLGKAFRLMGTGVWEVDAGWGLSYLHGRRISLGSVQGEVVATSATNLGGSATQTDSNSAINTLPPAASATDPPSFNAPFGRQAQASGSGHALDLGMVFFHVPSATRIKLGVADVSARIDWRDVPTNVSGYTTATQYLDGNGYVNLYPSSTRTSSYQDIRQTLAPKWLLQVSRALGNVEVEGAASYSAGYWFPQLGLRYPVAPDWQLRADYETRFRTLALSLEHSLFRLTLGIDSQRAQTAQAYRLAGAVAVAF